MVGRMLPAMSSTSHTSAADTAAGAGGDTVVVTFGHGTAPAERISALLRAAGVRSLVDVRTAPGSRRNPDVTRAQLERWLPESGIEYRWERRLGGWRKTPPDSPDTALRNRSFAGYAAHMRTPEFRAAIDDLMAQAEAVRTSIMCAESVWWRCHRRMVADFLVLVRGVPVVHLMHDGTQQSHVPSELARIRDDGLLVYDAGQAPMV
jgi:uncharacterized protein (DUF488 family)